MFKYNYLKNSHNLKLFSILLLGIYSKFVIENRFIFSVFKHLLPCNFAKDKLLSSRYLRFFLLSSIYSIVKLTNKIQKVNSNLFNPLAKISFFFIIITVNSVYALNVTTAESIQGSQPYLTLGNGSIKADNSDSLLSITLSNGKVITPSDDVSSITNPIYLPHSKQSFTRIRTIIPFTEQGNPNYPQVKISDLIGSPFNFYADDDGDGFDENGNVTATASGNISLKWEARNPKVPDINAQNAYIDITSTVKNNPREMISLCDSPYRLTISTSDGELKTEYGKPNNNIFTQKSHTYYISAKMLPTVCYAQPNLLYDNASYGNNMINVDYDGPLWDSAKLSDNEYRGFPSKGFKVRNAHTSGEYEGENSVYNNNFPSTGSNGLYFYLLLKGATPEEMLAANGSTIIAKEGGRVKLSLSVESTPKWRHDDRLPAPIPYWNSEPALKVTLSGPHSGSNTKTFNPATFKLYTDSAETHTLYEFKIMRWYIPQPKVTYGEGDARKWSKSDAQSYQAKARAYCSSLGANYRLANISDFTNANRYRYGWNSGIAGRGSKAYRRQLSYLSAGNWVGGINNEWGCLVNDWNAAGSDQYRCSGYSGSDWDSYAYWTDNLAKDVTDSEDEAKPLVNPMNVGEPMVYDSYDYQYRAACVSP